MHSCLYCKTPAWSLSSGLCDSCLGRFSEAQEKPKRPRPVLVVDNGAAPQPKQS